mmetsp:Transcript_22083/g.22270  ORF Transcript_22083/g.22270 Transcript_22083/m.22270 type:complete len:455 (-) Transcript_22083:223-1587(-)
MSPSLLFLTATALSWLFATAQHIEPPSDFSQYVAVGSLGNKNFTRILQKYPMSVVMFFTPWCSYSKIFHPIFEEASAVVNANNGGLNFWKVDCIAHKEIYWAQKLDHFPTVKVFIDKDVFLYEGELELDPFLDFLAHVIGSGVFDMGPENKGFVSFSKQFLSPATPILLISLKSQSSQSILPQEQSISNIKYLCKTIKGIKCAVTTYITQIQLNNDIINLNTGSGDISLHLIREFPNEPSYMSLSSETVPSVDSIVTDRTSLRHWILRHFYPLVVASTPATYSLMFDSQRPGFDVHIISIIVTNSSHSSFPHKKPTVSTDIIETKSFNMISSYEFLKTLATEYLLRSVFITLDLSSTSEKDYVDGVLQDIDIDRNDVYIPDNIVINTSFPYISSIVIAHSQKTILSLYKIPPAVSFQCVNITSCTDTKSKISQWIRRFFDGELMPHRVTGIESS